MAIFAVLLALALFCAYKSARDIAWHRACARILCVLTLSWGAGLIFAFGASPSPGTPMPWLLAMFGVPLVVYIIAIVLRWVFAPLYMPVPIASLRLIGILISEAWISLLRWSSRFGADSLN